MDRVERLITECPAWEPKNDISAPDQAEVKVPKPAIVSREIRPCPDFIPVYDPRDY